MLIDLKDYTGKYNLTVNAQVSSQSSDYGYATVTSSTTAPTYNNSTGRFIYISGEKEAQDYTTVLQGGQEYYLHLGYYKNASTSSGEDKFTVNSVEVTLNDSELYHTEITTDSKGQAITQIPFGKYQITETQAPEGYEKIENPITIEFRAEGNSVVTNENNVQATVNEEGEFVITNNKTAKVIVHHYLKDNTGNYTTEKVAEDELLEGKNGEDYTTSPKLDLKDYELEKDAEGNYVIPENATGIYTPGTQEVKYYYEEKEIPLTVHHYIEGTTEKVPLKEGGVAEDQEESGKEGENYETSEIADSLLSDDYELVEKPENASGTYSGEEVIVIYYYKRTERQVILTKYDEDGKTPLEGVKFEIQTKENKEKVEQLEKIAKVGELQQNGNYYFVKNNGKYISNNQQQNSTTAKSYIKVDLTDKEDVTLKINAEVSSQTSDYGYVTITNTTTAPSYSSTTGRLLRISGQQEAQDYETTLTGGQVYYIHLGYYKNSSTSSYDDTFTVNSIKINDTEISEWYKEEYTTNNKGQIELTLQSGEYIAEEIEVPEGYELPVDAQTEFNITKQTNIEELEITNTKKKGTVITHYYIEGTTDKVPLKTGGVAEDVEQTGNVGDIYATKEAENVADNYEFVEVQGETSGEIVEGTTVVTYYYKIKEPTITTPEITKESSIEKVTNVGQTIDYTISYNTTVDEYIGKATITIVDQLPFEIDEQNSNIAGGTYNKANKTITWTEEVGEIDTFVNGAKEIRIEKQISLVYKNVDTTKNTIENTVTGTINLETPEKEETVEDTKEIPAEYFVNIEVTKEWSDNNNEANKRPSGVEIVVKNGTEEVGRQEVNESTQWKATFNNLPKYDESGNQTTYTITEEEKTEEDLKFYTKGTATGSIEAGYTITNTFTVPDVKVSVDVRKEWEDIIDQQDKRPTSITIVLSGNGKTEEKNNNIK